MVKTPTSASFGNAISSSTFGAINIESVTLQPDNIPGLGCVHLLCSVHLLITLRSKICSGRTRRSRWGKTLRINIGRRYWLPYSSSQQPISNLSSMLGLKSFLPLQASLLFAAVGPISLFSLSDDVVRHIFCLKLQIFYLRFLLKWEHLVYSLAGSVRNFRSFLPAIQSTSYYLRSVSSYFRIHVPSPHIPLFRRCLGTHHTPFHISLHRRKLES